MGDRYYSNHLAQTLTHVANCTIVRMFLQKMVLGLGLVLVLSFGSLGWFRRSPLVIRSSKN